MKRLKLSMFREGIGHAATPARAETPWKDAFLTDEDYGVDFDAQGLNELLGLWKEHPRAWYSRTSMDNPLAELPAAVVIEKVNRAAELLGILED